MKKLLASSMGSNEKVNSNKLFCTLKIDRICTEKNKIFFVPVLTDAGFPIWWYVAPTIINTFMESYDFAGKKIALFATSGGSGFGKTVEKLAPSVDASAKFVSEKLLNRATEADIAGWLKTWM